MFDLFNRFRAQYPIDEEEVVRRAVQSGLALPETLNPRKRNRVEAIVVRRSGHMEYLPPFFNSRVNIGAQLQSIQMGSGVNTTCGAALTAGSNVVITPSGGTGMVGIALVNGSNAPTNNWQTLYIGGSAPEAVRVTATTATTFTVAALANNHAATDPIVGGAAPALFIALSTSTLTPAATDTTLSGETSVSGLTRRYATYQNYTAPTTLGGAASYQLATTFTAGGTATIQSVGLFTGVNTTNSGNMFSEANLSVAATLASGDQVIITWTINI